MVAIKWIKSGIKRMEIPFKDIKCLFTDNLL